MFFRTGVDNSNHLLLRNKLPGCRIKTVFRLIMLMAVLSIPTIRGGTRTKYNFINLLKVIFILTFIQYSFVYRTNNQIDIPFHKYK